MKETCGNIVTAYMPSEQTTATQLGVYTVYLQAGCRVTPHTPAEGAGIAVIPVLRPPCQPDLSALQGVVVTGTNLSRTGLNGGVDSTIHIAKRSTAK